MTVLVDEEGGAILGEGREGRASVAIPFSTDHGTFWLRAWDRISVRSEYHQPTLFLAGVLAVILVGLAWLIFGSQKRSFLEAAQRVSFTNRVSHELGTPLTNMTLNLELAERMVGSEPAKVRARLAKVREEVFRLNRLVGNVLARSRRDQGKLRESVEKVVPDELIGVIVEQFRPALERRGIEMEWDEDAKEEVILDADALVQVVWNLISNVEKHAASGGWLGLASRVEKGAFVFEVHDRGEGIPEEDRERVFEAYERVHTGVNEGVSGTGLGLSICRDLVTMMSGSLTLQPSETGAFFKLILPSRS